MQYSVLFIFISNFSNIRFGLLDICALSKLFLSLNLELLYHEQTLGPLRLFLYLQTKERRIT